MSGCAVGIQRLEQTCAGHSEGLEAGQGGGHLCSASPWPSQDPPAPGTGPAGGVPSSLALVLSSPLLCVTWAWLLALLLPGDSPLSWIRACLRWALPPWAAGLPLPVVLISLWSAARVQIFAVPLPEHILLPTESLPAPALEKPFPSRRRAPAACARLKMEPLASYCSSARSLGGSETVPFGGQGV